MKISIIVPIFNSRKYLRECLDSIKNQTFINFEVIMIDDGSTDDSGDICLEFTYDNRFKYIKLPINKGVSYARNMGIKLAGGEYICFVDSDDRLSRNYLDDLVKYANSNNMVCCDLTNKPEDILISNEDVTTVFNNKEKYRTIFENCGCFMCNRLYVTRIIKQNKISFNNKVSMSEDLIFNLEYLKKINEVVYLRKNNYYYRCREDSLTNSLKNLGWFTIVEPIKKLIEEVLENGDSFTQRKTKYYCKRVEIEYKYRERILDMDNNSQLDTLKVCEKRIKERLYFMDYVKLFIAKACPRVLLKKGAK